MIPTPLPTFGKLFTVVALAALGILCQAKTPPTQGTLVPYPGYLPEYRYTVESTQNLYYQMPLGGAPPPVWGQWTTQKLAVRYSGGYATQAKAKIKVEIRLTKQTSDETLKELPIQLNSTVLVQTNAPGATRLANNGVDGDPAINGSYSTTDIDKSVRLFKAKPVIERTFYLEGQTQAQGYPGNTLVDFEFGLEFPSRQARLRLSSPLYVKKETSEPDIFILWQTPLQNGEATPIATRLNAYAWHLANRPEEPSPFYYNREIAEEATAGGPLGGTTELNIGLPLAEQNYGQMINIKVFPWAWEQGTTGESFTVTGPIGSYGWTLPHLLHGWDLKTYDRHIATPEATTSPLEITRYGNYMGTDTWNLVYKWPDGINAKATLSLQYVLEAEEVQFTHGVVTVNWESLETAPFNGGGAWSDSPSGSVARLGTDLKFFNIAQKVLAVAGAYSAHVAFAAALGDLVLTVYGSENDGATVVTPLLPIGADGLSESPNWRVQIETPFYIYPDGTLANGQWQARIPISNTTDGYLVRRYGQNGYVETDQATKKTRIPWWQQPESRRIYFWTSKANRDKPVGY